MKTQAKFSQIIPSVGSKQKENLENDEFTTIKFISSPPLPFLPKYTPISSVYEEELRETLETCDWYLKSVSNSNDNSTYQLGYKQLGEAMSTSTDIREGRRSSSISGEYFQRRASQSSEYFKPKDSDPSEYIKPDGKICQQCNKHIKKTNKLFSILREEITSDKLGSKMYRCQVCGYVSEKSKSLNSHLNQHFRLKEVHYCLNCQEEINSLSCEMHLDPADRQRLLHTTTFTRSLLSIKKQELYKPPSLDTPPVCARCGNCGKIIGYTFALIHKLMEAYLETFAYTAGKSSTLSVFICRICCVKSRHQSSMEVHIYNHIVDKEVLCKICDIGIRASQKSDTMHSKQDAIKLKTNEVSEKNEELMKKQESEPFSPGVSLSPIETNTGNRGGKMDSTTVKNLRRDFFELDNIIKTIKSPNWNTLQESPYKSEETSHSE